jgi:hypothetical protein
MSNLIAFPKHRIRKAQAQGSLAKVIPINRNQNPVACDEEYMLKADYRAELLALLHDETIEQIEDRYRIAAMKSAEGETA